MDIEKIGSTIKDRRKFLKITQEDLAYISESGIATKK